jgi:DNA-binding transcriptional regulator LsrR (DeoR family)
MNCAVGDILSQFYDKNGNIVECDLHERLVTTKLNVLKTYSNVIGVAVGESKVDAIHAALLGGYLDVLVTDEDTAQLLAEVKS